MLFARRADLKKRDAPGREAPVHEAQEGRGEGERERQVQQHQVDRAQPLEAAQVGHLQGQDRGQGYREAAPHDRDRPRFGQWHLGQLINGILRVERERERERGEKKRLATAKRQHHHIHTNQTQKHPIAYNDGRGPKFENNNSHIVENSRSSELCLVSVARVCVCSSASANGGMRVVRA